MGTIFRWPSAEIKAEPDGLTLTVPVEIDPERAQWLVPTLERRFSAFEPFPPLDVTLGEEEDTGTVDVTITPTRSDEDGQTVPGTLVIRRLDPSIEADDLASGVHAADTDAGTRLNEQSVLARNLRNTFQGRNF